MRTKNNFRRHRGWIALTLFWAVRAFAVASFNAEDASQPPPSEKAADAVLRWDAKTKRFPMQVTDNLLAAEFAVTNASAGSVPIEAVEPSCGCTVAQPPADPWVLAPGESAKLKLQVDFTGKEGELTKDVFVRSALGTQKLRLILSIPPRAIENDPLRQANVATARVNRQAVFLGDCARCHATPTVGERGAQLYVHACGICHSSDHRASIVPDIVVAKIPRDAAYWREVIRQGRPGTLMPAFARSEGGPLDDEQIESLVKFVERDFVTETEAH